MALTPAPPHKESQLVSMPLTALERLKAARCQVKFPEEKESVHDIIVRLACKSQAGSERSS